MKTYTVNVPDDVDALFSTAVAPEATAVFLARLIADYATGQRIANETAAAQTPVDPAGIVVVVS